MKIFIYIYPHQNYITLGIVYLWLNFFSSISSQIFEIRGSQCCCNSHYFIPTTGDNSFSLLSLSDFFARIIFLIVLDIYLEPVNKWQGKSITPTSRNVLCGNKERLSIHINRRHLCAKYDVTRPAIPAALLVIMVQWEKFPQSSEAFFLKTMLAVEIAHVQYIKILT